MTYRLIFTFFILFFCANNIVLGELKSGRYVVNQSWSQERSFDRPYWVQVPKKTREQPLRLFIFLHGHGGNAERAQAMSRRFPKIASNFIMVYPQGYKNCWNIVSERSKAPDREFIESIVKDLIVHSNVRIGEVVLMGSSNGGALVNQIAIETRMDHFSHYVTMVSQLNVWQHDGNDFKLKGGDNNYKEVANPLSGKFILNVSGFKDNLVPYAGGFSNGIRAKDSKLAFVHSEQSIFLWAKHFGFTGNKLNKPSKTAELMDIFSYLDGAVIHYKMNNLAHNASKGLSESMLLDFLSHDPKRE